MKDLLEAAVCYTLIIELLFEKNVEFITIFSMLYFGLNKN